jgi:two-component system, OmpR family, response regulator
VRVLIIDDEPDIRRVARLSLVKIGGMEVLDAASGLEGTETAAAQAPDAILLDVMMPGLDGPATLHALRADPRTAGIPVVFLTAKAMPEEVARLLAMGVHGVLNKPFDPMTLPSQLRAALDHARP